VFIALMVCWKIFPPADWLACVRHRGRLPTSKKLSQLVLSPDNLLGLEIKSIRVFIVAWKFVETVVGGALSVASTVFNAEVAIFMGGSKMDSAFLRGVGEYFLPSSVKPGFVQW
jgi:hypothetical protein